MNLEHFYKIYPTKESCIAHLEELKWGSGVKCPYCSSSRHSKTKDHRYYCNNCLSSYSVTVGTMFHKTRVDLQKWFYAINAVLSSASKISSRTLAEQIGTTKDTAWLIMKKIDNAILRNDQLIMKIKNYEK